MDAARRRRSNAGPRRRALTLIELVMGMAGTALVASALAAMMELTVYGSRDITDLHRMVIREKRVGDRMAATLRRSHSALASGTDYLVLWEGDTNESGGHSLSELVRIERDDGSSTLSAYQAPATLDPLDDTEYVLGTSDFNIETLAIKGTANFPATLWAEDVTAWTLTLNHVTPQNATLVSYRLQITTPNVTDTAIGAAALRNRD